MYQIGKITNTHGIKGEVKIYSLSDFDRFLVGHEIYTLNKNDKTVFEIEQVRMHKGMYIVKFKGYDNINDILPYKGLFVYSDEEIEDQLEDDDYHYEDVIGKDVILENNEVIGKAVSLIEVPQGHLLEIEKLDGKKVLVPFIKEFIGEIDDQSIVIKPIEGLL
ncbi:16S rRNA processing protein RimM [Tenericutes bacterium MZ-XQ]|jgi:16S rRNA processing protein RimM|nr:16S rRNA processing protein RimM [Tenericutes bacterium MZ-XQ]